MTGGMGVAYAVEEEVIRSAHHRDGKVTVTTNLDTYAFDYPTATSQGGAS
jgi:hypothetical protein